MASNEEGDSQRQPPSTPPTQAKGVLHLFKNKRALDDLDDWPEASSPSPAPQDKMRKDFEKIGYAHSKINEMMSRNETGWDSLMSPRRSKIIGAQPATERGQPEPKVQKRNSVREQVRLSEDENWVLFDCLKPLPAFAAGRCETPSIFNQYVRYQPGNSRVVEYNIKTGNCRIKSTPHDLKDKSVVYTKNGPVLNNLETSSDLLPNLAGDRAARGGRRPGGSRRARGHSRSRGGATRVPITRSSAIVADSDTSSLSSLEIGVRSKRVVSEASDAPHGEKQVASGADRGSQERVQALRNIKKESSDFEIPEKDSDDSSDSSSS